MQIQPILGYFWAILGLYQPPGPPFLHILDPPLNCDSNPNPNPKTVGCIGYSGVMPKSALYGILYQIKFWCSKIRDASYFCQNFLKCIKKIPKMLQISWKSIVSYSLVQDKISWNQEISSQNPKIMKFSEKPYVPITFSSPKTQPEVVLFLVWKDSPYFSHQNPKISASNSLHFGSYSR